MADVSEEAMKVIALTEGMEIHRIRSRLQAPGAGRVSITTAPSPDFIRPDLTAAGEKNSCRVVIRGEHTRITGLYVNLLSLNISSLPPPANPGYPSQNWRLKMAYKQSDQCTL